MGPIGVQEMIVIFMIALLLFGPKKLPELGRTLGKALTEFRRAKNELKTTFESHMRELEKETQLESPSSTSSLSSNYTPAPYTYPYDDYGRYDGGDTDSTAAPRELSGEQKAAIEANAAAADPAAYGVKPEEPVPAANLVPGTVPRNNGAHSVAAAPDGDHRV